MTGENSNPLTGRHVLAMVLAFFGVVLAVNGIFVLLALGSWTGIETENAYLAGLQYEEQLREAQAQRALGWRLEYAWTGEVIEARLLDAGAEPVRGVELAASLRRPTHEGEDMTVALYPGRGGLFRSDALALGDGQWKLVILATREGETVFRREDRVWIK